MSIWYALDVLMLIGLAIALVFNYARKSAEGGRDPGEPVTRRYLEVNAAFFLTAGRCDPVPAQLVFAAGPGTGTVLGRRLGA